jgi:hypothetical protein
VLAPAGIIDEAAIQLPQRADSIPAHWDAAGPIEGGWKKFIAVVEWSMVNVRGRVGIHYLTFGACSSFTRIAACRIACPSIADSCPEASTWPVAQPSRSVASMPTDNYMGGIPLHN